MPVAAALTRLLDDASPGAAPDADPSLDGLVGSRVVADVDLPTALGPSAATLAPTVVVTGGAGQVAGPVVLLARHSVRPAALHLTLRDPGDPAGAARRVVAALDDARRAGHLADDVPVRFALPASRPTHGWLAAADELAAADLGLLLPTAGDADGGADGGAAIDSETVVAWVDAALAREQPFALAAGAHRAVRTGAAPGLLNLLLATRSMLDGAAADDLVWLLDQTDGERLVDLVTEHGDDALARARRWFTTAAVTDPRAVASDLRGLGLVA